MIIYTLFANCNESPERAFSKSCPLLSIDAGGGGGIRVYRNVKKLSESLCLLIYIGPIYMQPISAKKMIFGAFSSLGHLFLVFGLLRG